MDDDGFDSKLIPIRAKVTVAGDTLTIDLSESARQVTGFYQQCLRQYKITGACSHNVPRPL